MTEAAQNRAWKNRIVGYDDVAPDQLLAHPDNYRRHPQRQQRALEAVIDDVGVVQSVVVNRPTGRVIDGHLRVELALRRGEATVPVTYVDLSDEDEAKALATFDAVGGLAYADLDQLQALTSRTQFDDPDVMDMLADLVSGASATPGIDAVPPSAFPEYDEDIETTHECPKCGYTWS